MRVILIALLAAISYAQTDEEMKELESQINGLESDEFLEELEKVVGMESKKDVPSSSSPGASSSSHQDPSSPNVESKKDVPSSSNSGDASSSHQDPSSSKANDPSSSSDNTKRHNAPDPHSPDQSTPEGRSHARGACEMALNNYLSRVCQVGLIRHEGGTNEKVKILCEYMARKPSMSVCEGNTAKESGIDVDACKAMATKIKTKVFDLKAMCAQKVQKDFPQDVFIGYDGSPVFVRRDSMGARVPDFAKDTEQQAGPSSPSVWDKLWKDKEADYEVHIGPDLSPTLMKRRDSDVPLQTVNSAPSSTKDSGSKMPERSHTGTVDTGVFSQPKQDKDKKSPKASTKQDAEVSEASFVHFHYFFYIVSLAFLIFFCGFFFGKTLKRQNRDASYSFLSEV